MVRKFTLSLIGLLLVIAVGWAQSGDREKEATVKLVDPVRRLVVISVREGNGNRNYEVKVPDDVKFETKDGKKLKDGLKDPMFQNRDNRFSLPITLQYSQTKGGVQTIKKISMR